MVDVCWPVGKVILFRLDATNAAKGAKTKMKENHLGKLILPVNVKGIVSQD